MSDDAAEEFRPTPDLPRSSGWGLLATAAICMLGWGVTTWIVSSGSPCAHLEILAPHPVHNDERAADVFAIYAEESVRAAIRFQDEPVEVPQTYFYRARFDPEIESSEPFWGEDGWSGSWGEHYDRSAHPDLETGSLSDPYHDVRACL